MTNHAGYARAAFEVIGSSRKYVGWDGKDVSIPGNDENREVHEFLGEIFARPIANEGEDYYKLTMAIAEKLYADDLFGGLIYPSIGFKANADNLAIKAPFADLNLKLERIEHFRIDDTSDASFSVTYLDSAIVAEHDGRIQWRGFGRGWRLSPGMSLVLSVENGEWVARNSTGEMVPHT